MTYIAPNTHGSLNPLRTGQLLRYISLAIDANGQGKLTLCRECLALARDEIDQALIETGTPLDLSQYRTSAPEGYSTVLGWLADNEPDLLLSVGCLVKRNGVDESALFQQCKAQQLSVAVVSPPQVLKDLGVRIARAFPEDVIAAHFHDDLACHSLGIEGRTQRGN